MTRTLLDIERNIKSVSDRIKDSTERNDWDRVKDLALVVIGYTQEAKRLEGTL